MARAGSMRHRVEIQTNTHGNDWTGSNDAWATDDTVWAEIKPLRGAEKLNAEQVYGTVTHSVTIRAGQTVNTEKRLKFGSRYLYVKGVTKPDEIDHWIIILCEERT